MRLLLCFFSFITLNLGYMNIYVNITSTPVLSHIRISVNVFSNYSLISLSMCMMLIFFLCLLYNTSSMCMMLIHVFVLFGVRHIASYYFIIEIIFALFCK